MAFVLQPILLDLCDLYVANFMSTDGSWNWPKFNHLLSHNAVMRIALIYPPLACNGVDESTGQLLHKENSQLDQCMTFWLSRICMKGIISGGYLGHGRARRVCKIFIWLVLHNHLKT